jgi:anaerobic dimethyl sulfoxide reductase subunit C (anchor subunit)
METREWALITFTILAQMSVGAFIVLGIMHAYAQRKAGMEQADQLSDRALLAIVPTLGLGMLASFLHLGNPFNGYLAVLNVGKSWLSREILFGVLFAGVAALFVIMQWFKIRSFTERRIVGLVAVVLGLALVFSMSQAYALSTVPSWNSPMTPISFFTTTFLLGALSMGAALVANYAYVRRKNPACADVQCSLLRDTMRWVVLLAIALLGVEFLVVPLQVASLAAMGSEAAAKSAALYGGEYSLMLALRLALVFTGAGVLGVFVYQNASSPGREKMMGNLTYLAFLLVLVGEVLGRFLFYATFAKIGVL